MTEIEKMYRNAGLIYCDKCRHDRDIDCLYLCENKYPPFTAEKQLELIKWLVHKGVLHITTSTRNEYRVFGFIKTGDYKIEFEETLASYVNYLWQDLTEEGRKQIKEILESEVRE